MPSLDSIGNFEIQGHGNPQQAFSQLPQTQQVQQPQVNQQQVVQQQGAPNQTGVSSPLDKWAFLNDNTNNQQQLGPDGKPVVVVPPVNVFELDPKALTDAAGKADFTGMFPEGTVKSIIGAAATKEQIANFQATMNQFGQTLLGQSLNANHALAKSGVNQTVDASRAKLMNEMTFNAAKDFVMKEFPHLNNAVHAPMIQNVVERIQQAKPGINATDLHELTVEYLKSVGMESKKEQSSKASGVRTIGNFFDNLNK